MNCSRDHTSWIRRSMRRPVPVHLSSRFTQLDPAGTERLRASLSKHFFSRRPASYLEAPSGQRDLADHLQGRLQRDREEIIPWLDRTRTLDGLVLLEIGCGTGASTVALSEQGTSVYALDLDAQAIEVARDRCGLHRQAATFRVANAVEADQAFPDVCFDAILFFATLEHMTIDERLVSLRRAWATLPPGGLLAIVETPNRLWYHDGHTSLLPFYHWLPDELAMAYASRSPREHFREAYNAEDALLEHRRVDFIRQGRGVSYHELELALDCRFDRLPVVSCLAAQPRLRQPLEALRRWRHRWTLDGRAKRLLGDALPGLHPGLVEPSLDLVLQK